MNARLTSIKKNVVRQFREGKWQNKASEYVNDTSKMNALLAALLVFFKRRSIAPMMKNAILLYYYVKDIVDGKYKYYSKGKMILVVAVLIYVVSPLDLIPDFITGLGLLDDMALVAYAMKTAEKELRNYFNWRKAYLNAKQ